MIRKNLIQMLKGKYSRLKDTGSRDGGCDKIQATSMIRVKEE
jgi:hypothetical protein